jgi:hypothetical protein
MGRRDKMEEVENKVDCFLLYVQYMVGTEFWSDRSHNNGVLWFTQQAGQP